MATDKENIAAERVNRLSDWNRETANLNLKWMNELYEKADKQNQDLLRNEISQNRRDTEANRFNAQRNLQNAMMGAVNTTGSGMNGSAASNLSRMAFGQNDADNVDYWNNLRKNQDTVGNAYQESANQNYLSRAEAAINAEVAKRDIEGNQSASLNDINQDLWVDPSTHASYSSRDASGYKFGSYDTRAEALNEANNYITGSDGRPKMSPYVTNGYANAARNMQSGSKASPLNDYFSRLLRGE